MKNAATEINAARFFAGAGAGAIGGSIGDKEIYITGDDAKHISTVLRMSVGDRIVVCDGAGTDYTCEILYASHAEVRAIIMYSRPNTGEPAVKVTIYQSLPRSDKFNFVAQKNVEAGASRIVPVVSERSQHNERMDGEGGEKLLKRWRRIAYEAAKQSGRGVLPEIGGYCNFTDAVDECSGVVNEFPESALALIPYEYEEKVSIKSELAAFKRRVLSAGAINSEVFIFIGPEGGFSEAEIDYGVKNGVRPVTLGPRILRTETAGLAALCQIMYEFEM